MNASAIVFDGLIIAKWGRPVFEDMCRGGLTAANCTCFVWEGFQGTLTAALLRAGWSEPKVRKVMGENWVRVLGQAWGE